MCMAQFVSAGYIMAENLKKSRQDRTIDAYLHYRQKELLELERANDLTIRVHTNAYGVMFMDTAVKHKGSGVTKGRKCRIRIQHGQESGRWLEGWKS